MKLLPREYNKLALHGAGSLAQKRLARGIRLNHPEAVALIATQEVLGLGISLRTILEFIRDGDKSVADLMELGRHLLGKRQVLPAVPSLIESVQVEGTFPDGTKLVTVTDPFPDLDGDLVKALYGSFLPVPDLSKFDCQDCTGDEAEELPLGGSSLPGKLMINANRKAVRLCVKNSADRPIQIGSHYHFIETNPLLIFDREKAYGKRLNIIAGTAKRFEAGDTCCVTLVEIGGNKRITGGNGLASGPLDPSRLPEIMKAVIERNFGHEKEDDAPEGITGQDMDLTTMVNREKYMDIFGPTTGDKIRLGDTTLVAEVEKDFAVYGDECKFGGGKVLREGMGQVSGYLSADVLDVVITNALVIDYTGIYKADIGIKGGLISAIGKAGNPDVMNGVHSDMVVGVNTEVIAGEGLILTTGGIDSHIHFICPQLVDEAIASGITTMIGGGTGPAHGSLATTCTPAPEQMRTMLIATDELPLNFGFSGKGNTSEPEGLADIIKAGAICLKLHEDWGSTPAAIDTCLKVADEFDIQVTIHTDTLNESGCVEETVKAIGDRCIHTYHSEGAGGGHAPDILKVCGLLNVLPSSTNPTRPFTSNTVDEHRDMLMVCHHLDKNIPEDVKFADSRIRAQTIAAEDILHDLGAISMISSDSQAMGRVGEVITRTWQTAHKMRRQRGQLPESEGVKNDNFRIKRYIAKYTINPAIAHGISHIVGSVEVGKLADLVLWTPEFFGTKPEMVLKGGTIAWAQMGDANGSIPTPEPKRMKPMFGAVGKAGSLHSVAFVSQAAVKEGVKKNYNLQKRVEVVRNTRKLKKTDMKLNSATPDIEVDPTSFITTADGVELKAMDIDLGSVSLMDLLLKNQVQGAKLNGSIRVERVYGKSSATRSYATYPLQFMIPKKAISSDVDAVLVYALTFGGGIVSGDCIFFELDVGVSSTMTLLTQGFTNVYKSVEGKMSRQILKCSVGSGGLLALLPDSVLCFATARYSQVQGFNLAPDANLVLVDWLTSGRVARGEVWNFDYFRSTNHVYIQGDTPLLLDSVCLDHNVGPSISERMGDYHVIAMIFIYGPRLAELRKLVQSNVQNLASGALNTRRNTLSTRGDQRRTQWPQQSPSTPAFFASCSTVGPLEDGLVVRVASTNTILMYRFLREQLATLQPILGMLPYGDN